MDVDKTKKEFNDLKKAVEDYCEWELDDDNKKIAQSLLHEACTSEEKAKLEDIFMTQIKFGTAGLRAEMGPGFNRFNMVTVMQITAAIRSFIIEQYGSETCSRRGVVIGFDGRKDSCFFAHVAAAVFLDQNIKVYLNSLPTATPLNPFAVLQYKCLVGCQITASHNPKQYNGYKIYNEMGAQVVPPMEDGIIKWMSQSRDAWGGIIDLLDMQNKRLKNMEAVIDPYNEIVNLYMETISSSFLVCKHQNYSSTVPFVYTALHGVGAPFIRDVVSRFGFDTSKVHFVQSQSIVDPLFSTVKSPNPEDKDALKMAMELAESKNIAVVAANDPDVDRFVCAERQDDGHWKIFTGNEIGIMFAAESLLRLDRMGIPRKNIFFICSIVSSRMLKAFVEVEGCHYEETMTGFKWMMRRALQLMEQGFYMGLVYEEALGFALHPRVPDKDGISAMAVWFQMAARLHRQKITLTQHLDALRKKYGYFVENNSYYIWKNYLLLQKVFSNMRKGGLYQRSIGPYAIKAIRDITTGYDSSQDYCKCCFDKTPDSENITYSFENNASFTFRTSGTEPKLKYYAEISGSDPHTAQECLNEMVRTINQILLSPQENELIPPALS